MTDEKIKGAKDLRDVIVIFSILILIILAASLFDLFDKLHDIAANPEGFKVIELFAVLMLFGWAYAVFSRRRWGELKRLDIDKDKNIKELMDNNNRLKSTVDLSPDATIVHREGQVIFANKAAVTLFRAESEEDLLGLHIRDLLHYSVRDKVSVRIEQMVKYMKQVPVADIIVKRLDGSYIDVSVASTPVFYHAIPHIITIMRDITERKRSEQIKSELASIVLTSSDAITGITLDGIINSWNPAAKRLYGYSERDALGSPLSLILPEENKEEINYYLNKVTKDELIELFETKRLKKDKSIIDVSVSVSPIKDDSGVITGASTIARDITF